MKNATHREWKSIDYDELRLKQAEEICIEIPELNIKQAKEINIEIPELYIKTDASNCINSIKITDKIKMTNINSRETKKDN